MNEVFLAVTVGLMLVAALMAGGRPYNEDPPGP